MADTDTNANITLEEALKRIDQLEAQNAALRGVGKINREAKNSVFLDLFGRKEYLVRMCSLLHPEYGELSEDDLTVVTIENVLTIKHFNDMGVLLNRDKRKLLIMAEAQSLWSVNVIFRLWEYVIDTLMNYFINNGYDLYSTPKLPMPDVETYIIYTGKNIPKMISSGELETDERGFQVLSLNKEFFGGQQGKPTACSRSRSLTSSPTKQTSCMEMCSSAQICSAASRLVMPGISFASDSAGTCRRHVALSTFRPTPR